MPKYFLVQGEYSYYEDRTIFPMGLFTSPMAAHNYIAELVAFLQVHRYNQGRAGYYFDAELWARLNTNQTIDLEYHLQPNSDVYQANWTTIPLKLIA